MRHYHFLLVLFLATGLISAQPAPADFTEAHIHIQPDPVSRTLEGEVRYDFTSSGQNDSIFLDARSMEFQGVSLNDGALDYSYDGRRLGFKAPGEGKHQLAIKFTVRPRQTVYFVGWQDEAGGDGQIWTQGQGKYSSYWVPSFDAMEEKVVFDLSITYKSDKEVIANGDLKNKINIGNCTTWIYDMQRPMSSYLLAFAIGSFDSLRLKTDSGIPLELYFMPSDSAKVLSTYRFTKEVFDFLEAEIGYPYPWISYRQVPVRDFLYAGMENTGCTFFAQHFVTDSIGYADQPYLNVNAHEMAHQWFGNLVTETDGGQHWLHEGFATYYAYLAEAEMLGDEAIYWNYYRTAKALEQMDEGGGGASLLDPDAGSLIFYEKGAWALMMLREQVGEASFRKGIRDFLESYAYANATVDQFLERMADSGRQSLQQYRSMWLESPDFPEAAAMGFLKSRSPSLKYYMELRALQASGDSLSGQELTAAWSAFEVPEYRAALIRSFLSTFPEDLLLTSLQSREVAVQKALVADLDPMQAGVREALVRWLDGRSYELREAALFTLWQAFPEDRSDFLTHTAANGSFEAVRFRQLWWVLALFTEGFGSDAERQGYLLALRGTTSDHLDWQVRENGFRLLRQIDALGTENLRDLLLATEHPSWQFRKFARRMLDELLKDRPEPGLWRELSQPMPEVEFPYLHEKIRDL